MHCSTLTLGFALTSMLPFCIASADNDALPAPAISASDLCESSSSPDTAFEALPPCLKARVIEESICKHDDIDNDLGSHADCMCQSEFFNLKQACDQCILDHGGMSSRDFDFYSGILTQARDELCSDKTPDAPFASIWSTIRDSATMPTVGATELVDILGTATDQGLYHTATPSRTAASYPTVSPGRFIANASRKIRIYPTAVILDLATVVPVSRTRGADGLLTAVETTIRNNYTTTYYNPAPTASIAESSSTSSVDIFGLGSVHVVPLIGLMLAVVVGIML